MPMPIDSLANFLGSIAVSRVTRLRGRASRPLQSAAPRQGGEHELDLERAVANHIARLDRADPQYRKKSQRVFVECVLLHRFGAEWINSPELQEIVDEVQSAMERDHVTAAQLDTLLGQMGRRS